MKTLNLTLLAPPLLLSACSSQGSFPSLAPRPIELAGQSGVAATPSQPLGKSDPAIIQKADAAFQKAKASVAPFNAALSSARGSVSGLNGPEGSEAWVQAQMTISSLAQMARPASEALADLEDLKRQMVFAAPSSDYPAIDAKWREVFAINAAQNEALASLTP